MTMRHLLAAVKHCSTSVALCSTVRRSIPFQSAKSETFTVLVPMLATCTAIAFKQPPKPIAWLHMPHPAKCFKHKGSWIISPARMYTCSQDQGLSFYDSLCIFKCSKGPFSQGGHAAPNINHPQPLETSHGHLRSGCWRAAWPSNPTTPSPRQTCTPVVRHHGKRMPTLGLFGDACCSTMIFQDRKIEVTTTPRKELEDEVAPP